MKATILLLFSLTLIGWTHSEPELCLINKEECHSTNYSTYVECVRRRQKRSADCGYSCDSGNCIDTCNNCNCDECNYSSCGSTCGSCCSSCCSNYIPCHTHHCCHKTCHAQCSNASCRSSCRRNCFETVKEKTEEKIERERLLETAGSTNITNLNRHNVTTIIHLNNVINNTNVIDVPILVNNSNTQNITVYNEETNASSSSVTERCCTVISPRQCVSSPKPRCFHYRSKQCGPFCTANIIHKEEQQICQSNYPGAPPECKKQIIYIPQPQPKCTYQSVWPYVSCGIQKEETCQGCYNHYVNPESNNYLSCPYQCYDDGFGMGSLYRQGPVYRPWYSHSPCYECLGYQNPYGGFPGAQYGAVAYPQGYQGYPKFDQNGAIPILSIKTSDQLENVEMQPMQQTNMIPQDPDYRIPREVEIEVKYEPSSQAQAEVKIKKENDEIVPAFIANKDLDIIDIDSNSTAKEINI